MSGILLCFSQPRRMITVPPASNVAAWSLPNLCLVFTQSRTETTSWSEFALQALDNRTFTRGSLADNRQRATWPDTPREMDRPGRLLFVALVTCWLLGRILSGAADPAEVVVYGVTAAFGLEYLVASWDGLWQHG